MLRQRVVTAVLLLAVLLPALFYPTPVPFCAIALLFIAAGAWEWARLAGYGATASLAAGAACGAACAAIWAMGGLEARSPWLWAVVSLLWVLGGAWTLRSGIPAWQARSRVLRLGVGLVLLCLAWLAIAQARVLGINFLLSVLVLVWVADIFAYFAGRTWGGRFSRGKLAPSISPGKSWEGVWGGMAGVLALAVVWQWADRWAQADVPSLYGYLLADGRWYWLLAIAVLAGMSVVGDLVESLVKRAASVKDSSALLPGHGGVLDRIDALLPALPLAMLLRSLDF